MGKHEIRLSFDEYDDLSRLSAEDIELVKQARSVCASAYAPYSGFSVGVAIRLSTGVIVKGTNVENAAFPSGLCAEQNAISSSVSNHPGDYPVAMAIVAMNGENMTGEPVTPCGNCRQVIAEEEARNGRSMKIIMAGTQRIIVASKGSDLLPLQFSKSSMTRDRR